jgi:tetratricopeptide (TPR) repeat protein
MLDARSWVHYRAAIELEDVHEASEAFACAREIQAQDLRPHRVGYTDTFLAYLRVSVPARITDLASRPFVEADPALRLEASLLGGRGYRELDELASRGDLADALAFVEEALLRAPRDTWLEAKRGRLLLAMGREKEGLESLERSCAGWPEVPDCAFYAAEYFESRGARGEATRFLREALRRDPSYPPANEMIRRLSIPR